MAKIPGQLQTLALRSLAVEAGEERAYVKQYQSSLQ